MLVMRPVRTQDLDTLYELSLSTGGGLTTLPPNREVLSAKIKSSRASFKAEPSSPGDEYYLFSLEDTESGRVVGTSGIFASVGFSKPFYSYRLLHLTQVSHQPDMKVDTRLLQLVNDYEGATELGTLFLHPDWRKGVNGMMLSVARYLLMAAYPERFADKVMAEIRGWTDENGRSPFWEAIGRHFFGMDFAEADRINGMGNSQFIADLMPKFPIYTNLLPEQAQEVIGKPHDDARGAVRLLTNEGFRQAGAVDIFDAGPCYEVPRREIRTIRKARRVKLGEIAENKIKATSSLAMVATARMPDFRIVATRVVDMDKGAVTIDSDAARALGVKVGAELIVAPFQRREDQS